MKHLNEVTIQGTIGTRPRVQNTQRGVERGKPEAQILFPLVWTRGETTNLITASAISSTAAAIQRHVLPGEPLLVTGRLDRRSEGLRLRLSSIQRLVTADPTITVPGANGELFSLKGGLSEVMLRGHAEGDSVASATGFRFIMKLVEGNESRRVHVIPVVSQVPVRRGQAVTVTGEFIRSPEDEESAGYVYSVRTSLGESIEVAANLTNRDPRDRLNVATMGENLTLTQS